MKKLLFVFNPNAGKGLIKTELVGILDIFIKEGYLPTVYPTQSKRDAYKMIKKMEEKYDLIVCSGGDGTLDEVVGAVVKYHKKYPVGYIPAGSTNDFAKSLGISKNMRSAALAAVTGEKFPCDVGSFNGEIFVYIAAFGMFTDVSYATSQDIKNMLGHLAYVLEGVKRIYNIPSYHMKITYDDQQVKEGRFMFGMVSNSKSIGGLKNIIFPDVVFDDGEFEVILIRKPSNPFEIQELIGCLLSQQYNSTYMESFKASRLMFECEEEVAWTLDGEYGGEHEIVEVKNMKKAITIMVEKSE